MNSLTSLSQFYSLMQKSADLRREIVQIYLDRNAVDKDHIDHLHQLRQTLANIPQAHGGHRLQLDQTRSIDVDLSYELQELDKDIFFLEHSEEEFLAYLAYPHPSFDDTVHQLVQDLSNRHWSTFITDRDGTINNYCGRYASSIQSIYNAVFLTRFAVRCCDNAIIITSAPLDNIGLLDISVMPPNTYIYAGSKGREHFDRHHRRRRFPIDDAAQNKLSALNGKLRELVKNPHYEKFSLIGSGLQFKFGQTTIARQDISHSIPEADSLAFLTEIEEMVRQLDEQKEFFRIEDTGKDIEILLTIQDGDGGEKLKDFDKGDGLLFLNDDLQLQLQNGCCLVCGDTFSDVAMAKTARQQNPDTHTVFVTTDAALEKEVRTACQHPHFIPEPDILVAALNGLAQSV